MIRPVMALRPGNVDRAAYRTKCRKKLSEYLCESSRMTCDRGTLTIRPVSKLGLSVEPGDVRLITTADDPYRWQPLPEKEHLFKKQLSKHSVGAYRTLCREVGVSFEAVRTERSDIDARNELDEASANLLRCF